uniref:Uncharacterized protein n=1 Tax=Timema bartmani TaxID=61472 RepID=A0A7R9I1Y5_9NEOP|nr:unnamed protein product [Timema bartmani]
MSRRWQRCVQTRVGRGWEKVGECFPATLVAVKQKDVPATLVAVEQKDVPATLVAVEQKDVPATLVAVERKDVPATLVAVERKDVPATLVAVERKNVPATLVAVERKNVPATSRWNGRMFRQCESCWNLRKFRQCESRWNMRKSLQHESRWEWPPSKPLERRVLMGTEYRDELVTDGLENMDCGAVQAVERVGGAACTNAEERYKARLNTLLLISGNQPNIHPGSISSTGRQRVGPGSGTATSTQAAQLIGGGISPTLFTSPVSIMITEKLICNKDFQTYQT